MTAKKKKAPSQNLATILKTNPSVVSRYLAKQGRGEDIILAHINRREAAMLKAAGGSGKVNPNTGIMEFDDTYDFGGGGDYGGFEQQGYYGDPSFQAAPSQAVPETPNAAGVTGADYAPVSPMPSDWNTSASYGSPVAGPSGSAQFMTGAPAPSFGLSAAPVGGVPQVQPDVGTALEGSKTTPQQAQKPDWFDRNKGWALPAALGLLGGGAGLYQNRQMQQQAKGVQGQYAGLAAPYQQQGKELLALTQSGGLTPANAQILEAARAQSAQNVQARGGVGQAQETQRLANIAASLQQQQLTYAYQMMGIGDTIAAKGIEAGLAADQRARAANQQFYGTLASMLSRMQF